MRARRYNREVDLPSITAWASHYHIDNFGEWGLPKTGFIVPGVIVTFLYRTDSGKAYVEPTFSNPALSSIEKMEALQDVWTLMFREAKEDPTIMMLYATSSHDSIINAAKSMGFQASSKQAISILTYDVQGSR